MQRVSPSRRPRSAEPVPRRPASDRGFDRLITFMDAVVAIAITLLVLPLVDVLPEGMPDGGLGALLAEEAGQFGAFTLSFAVIARLWLAHHRLVELVGGYDGAFLAINLGWTLTVVLLPFATQVAAVYGSDRAAVALYIGTITASSALLSALSVLVWRRPELRRAGIAEREFLPWISLGTTGTLAVALVLGVLVPVVNYFALFLLFLSGPFERRLLHRPHRGPA